MAAEVVLSPEAERDISEAYNWYEQRAAGLGKEFLGRIDACMQSISRMPEMWAKVQAEYRRAIVRRFPYVIFYEHSRNTVTVYCVFHMSRNPSKWRERLP